MRLRSIGGCGMVRIGKNIASYSKNPPISRCPVPTLGLRVSERPEYCSLSQRAWTPLEGGRLDPRFCTISGVAWLVASFPGPWYCNNCVAKFWSPFWKSHHSSSYFAPPPPNSWFYGSGGGGLPLFASPLRRPSYRGCVAIFWFHALGT